MGAAKGTIIPRRISFEEYRAIEAVNWSSLKRGLVSMLHFRDALDGGDEDSSAKAFGRAAHCAVFEPEEFAHRYAVGQIADDDPEGNRRTAEGKAAHAALFPGRSISDVPSDQFKRALFASRNPGLELITQAELERSMIIGERLRTHREARAILSGGRPEVSIEWTDDETGLPCKARIDWLTPDLLAADLKTARSISFQAFRSQAWKLGYFHQLAFHSMGIQAITGKLPALRWLAIESERPYDCTVFQPDDTALDLADAQIRSLLVKLKWCREHDVWSGQYGDAVQTLTAPGWAVGSDDDTGEGGYELVPMEEANG